MTFANPKVGVKMRRKAWRPLNVGVKIYTVLRVPRYSVMRKARKEVLNDIHKACKEVLNDISKMDKERSRYSVLKEAKNGGLLVK